MILKASACLLAKVETFVSRSCLKFRPNCEIKGICPQYLQPTFNLLRCAHSAVCKLLPQGDCEKWEVVELARRYYNHWRPQKVKVILLAESHAFTTKVRFVCLVKQDSLLPHFDT